MRHDILFMPRLLVGLPHMCRNVSTICVVAACLLPDLCDCAPQDSFPASPGWAPLRGKRTPLYRKTPMWLQSGSAGPLSHSCRRVIKLRQRSSNESSLCDATGKHVRLLCFSSKLALVFVFGVFCLKALILCKQIPGTAVMQPCMARCLSHTQEVISSELFHSSRS